MRPVTQSPQLWLHYNFLYFSFVHREECLKFKFPLLFAGFPLPEHGRAYQLQSYYVRSSFSTPHRVALLQSYGITLGRRVAVCVCVCVAFNNIELFFECLFLAEHCMLL